MSPTACAQAAPGLIEGIELTQRDLLTAFEKHKIVTIEPQAGDRFDPKLHQAMFEAPVPGTKAGDIIQVMGVGFTIGDRLLRPAQVGVSSAALRRRQSRRRVQPRCRAQGGVRLTRRQRPQRSGAGSATAADAGSRWCQMQGSTSSFVPELVGERRPEADPERRADDVGGEEVRPGHPGRARDHPVELAKHYHEARDDDHQRPAAVRRSPRPRSSAPSVTPTSAAVCAESPAGRACGRSGSRRCPRGPRRARRRGRRPGCRACRRRRRRRRGSADSPGSGAPSASSIRVRKSATTPYSPTKDSKCWRLPSACGSGSAVDARRAADANGLHGFVRCTMHAQLMHNACT